MIKNASNYRNIAVDSLVKFLLQTMCKQSNILKNIKEGRNEEQKIYYLLFTHLSTMSN